MKRYFALIILLLPLMAMSQTLNVKLPEDSAFEILVDAETLPNISRMISCDEDKLTFISGNEIITLYNDSIYFWGDVPVEVLQSEKIVLCYGVLIYKSDKYIKAWYNDSTMNVIDMPDEKYSIFEGLDDVIYLVRKKNDKSAVNLFDVKTRMSLSLIEIPLDIECFSSNGLEIFISEGENIYYVSKELSLKIFSADMEVNSLAAGGGGVFYTTQKKCGYVGNLNESIDIFNGDVKQIMSSENKLYILFKNGMIASISNISEFNKIFDNQR